MLSETEDVAREDQIFLREGAEMAMAKGMRLPKEEYAKLSSTIMERQHIYGRPSFDYATTFDNFYVYDYLGDGNSFINFAIPIVGNEEFIHELSKIIEDGTIDSAASLDLFLKEILVGERSYHRDLVNAIKKRRGNKGFLVPRSRRQNNNTRGIPAFGKGSRGSIATRGESGNSNESGDQELDYRYSLRETDPEVLDKLNNGKTIKVYRAMQVIDGKLYPPMSARVGGKLRVPIALGEWERAEERPDLADDKGYFKLDKGNSTSLKARYNPYIHTSLTPLNDQFSSAQDRPNLVTVEVEIPESELTSGYKADKAKDAVGKLEWKAGVVQSQLTGTRTVILSRWDRPIRIVPDSEVAQRIVEMFGDTKVIMPSNVVTPSLREELEKLGVPFRETDNQGKSRYSLITPEMDASYLDAVERGDMATAQKMVMEAAKLAMPNTKVVDKKGNPLVVYHGTPMRDMFNSFDMGKGDSMIFLTHKTSVAEQYTHMRGLLGPRPEQTGRIMPLFVNLENPLEINANRKLWRNLRVDWSAELVDTTEVAQYARENGYDGVIIRKVRDNMYDDDPTYSDLYIAFSPTQVKSAGPSYVKAKRDHFPWDTYEKLTTDIGPTYDDNGNVIPLSERFNPRKEDIRYSLMQPTTEEVTFDNFFKNTSAVFELMPKSEVPQREPDYTSERWDGFGVSSRYWYGEDGLGKYVIRESNHWSDYPQGERTREAFEAEPYNKRYTRISSCRWALAVSKEQVTTEKDSYLDGDKMYGKAYLNEFTKWEDVRYALRSMDEGIAILRNKATEYNIDIPLMLIENADEYVMLMREENVKNPEKKANAFATYLSDKELICFNGSHFLDADDEFVDDAIMHEYAHHATHQMWNDVLRVITEANRSDILWVRDNVLSEHYNDITPAGTINEIISIFVERMGEEMRHKVFSGEYEIAKFLSLCEKEINDTEGLLDGVRTVDANISTNS